MGEEMTVCNDCGCEILLEDAELCSECGIDLCSECLSGDMMCEDCTAEAEENDLCDGCGAEVFSYDATTECPKCFVMVGPCCWCYVEEMCRYCLNEEDEK